MSITNSITKLLNFKENNLIFYENLLQFSQEIEIGPLNLEEPLILKLNFMNFSFSYLMNRC